ncbi:MAG: branched-chain amino acid ABC transporter permease [Candidatus Flexifilum sp.]
MTPTTLPSEQRTNWFRANRKLITTTLYVAAGVIVLLLLLPVIGAQRPSRLIQSGITGLLVGGIYALIALGIVIVNKASGVFNFAHGWLMLLGGLVFYSFFSVAGGQISPLAAIALPLITLIMAVTTARWSDLLKPRALAIVILGTAISAVVLLATSDVPLVRAIIGAHFGAILAGLMVERFAIRPLIGQPLFTMVLMTLALSEVLHGITQMTWGSVEIPLTVFAGLRELGVPNTYRIDAEALGGTIIVRPELLVAFILALAAFAIFVLFFRYTSVGLSMRATAENQKLAQSTGLRVRTILAVTWAIAAILAGTAGALQGGATSLSLNLPLLALRAFPAVLLGGLESVGGALVGGLVIGLVQEYGNLLFPGTQAGTDLAPYVVLMVVLIIRPDGLFGQKRIERI